MQTWTIAYRTGGTTTFKWNPTIGFCDKKKAEECLKAVRCQGYLAYLYDTEELSSCGLPETFNPEDSIVTSE